jgi:hypothetical protein
MPAKGPVTILATDIAVPPTYYLQDTYPEPYFQCLQPQPQRGAQDQVQVLVYRSSTYLSTLR